MIYTDVHGHSSLGNLLELYTEEMHPDEFEFNEPLCAVLDSVQALHKLLEPAWEFDAAKVQQATGVQVSDLKEFLAKLVARFEEEGACPVALGWFEKTCQLCWELDPTWCPPQLLRIPVNQWTANEEED